MGSLQSTLLGFLVFKVLQTIYEKYGIKYTPFSPLENVVLQSTAVATATMPLAGGMLSYLSTSDLTTIRHKVS